MTSLTLAYMSSQSTSAPTSVLDDAALIEESVEADDGLPAIDDAENELDGTDNSSELPPLDEAIENIDDAVEDATSE